MLILGIETSAKAVSAALCRDGELLAEVCQRSGLTHSRTLLPMISDMLKNTETPRESIDAVAVAVGPGSFTGIRISVSTAKGLCWGLDKPAAAVSTLAAMAHLVTFLPENVVVCPVMDARRSQVYNALFEMKAGKVCRLTSDRAVDAGELAEELKTMGRPVWVMGDGWKLFADVLEKKEVPFVPAPENLRWQNAWGVCLAAMEEKTAPAEELLPVYLRLSQAERERQERMERAK